jgi:hypothetical protein
MATFLKDEINVVFGYIHTLYRGEVAGETHN